MMLPLFPEKTQPMRRPGKPAGMTLMEVLVSAAIASVILTGAYALIKTGLLLSVKSLAINNTSTAARLGIDRAEAIIQQSYETPTLIASDGTSLLTSGPAPGLKFYKYVGGPYVVTIPTTGLSGTSRTITVTRDNTAQVPPPAPLANDAFIINTTILMSGSANQVRAYIKDGIGVIKSSTSGSKVTYTIDLARELVGNNGVIPYDKDTTVTAVLIRPTALAVVPTAKGRELRFYESFPESNRFDFTRRYSVFTNQVSLSNALATPQANDAMTDANGKPFSLTTVNDRTFVKAKLRIRDNRYNRYLDNKQADEFSTYIELSSLFSTKCNPNESVNPKQ